MPDIIASIIEAIALAIRSGPDLNSTLKPFDRWGIGVLVLAGAMATTGSAFSIKQGANAELHLACLILTPPAVFLIATVWIYVAVTRDSDWHFAFRILKGLLISLLAVPSAMLLLCLTCGPVTHIAGAPLAGKSEPGSLDAWILGSVTLLCFLFAGWMLFIVMSRIRNSS